MSVSGAAVILADVSENVMKGYLGKPKERWLNIDEVRINLDDDIRVCHAFKTGKPIVAENAMNDIKMKRWLVRFYHCKSVLFVPILGEKPIGCVVLSQSDRVRRFTQDDIQTAMAFSMSAGKAIEKHH